MNEWMDGWMAPAATSTAVTVEPSYKGYIHIHMLQIWMKKSVDRWMNRVYSHRPIIYLSTHSLTRLSICCRNIITALGLYGSRQAECD